MHRYKQIRAGRTLSVPDQKAVDVLLDMGATSHASRQPRHAAAVPPNRIAAAVRVLKLLSAMPAMDPPADLVARTMMRIDKNVGRQLGSTTSAQAGIRVSTVH